MTAAKKTVAELLVVSCALSLSACAGQAPTDADLATEADIEHVDAAALCSQVPKEIDARRSLAVTDRPILARFSFERVMARLAAQADVPGLTATALFQQWWDTQNPADEGGEGPHCDDEVDAQGQTLLNGYPYSCRPAPAEGSQASCDPFVEGSPCAYMPVGLFNRFDLAPEDGATCGEYRVVYAKESGLLNNRDRNLVIFEAVLPNPNPRRGLEGCRPIVEFWARLSGIADMERRADLLENFYFRGLGHHAPAVIDIRHFGDNARSAGQVRTNQFVQDGLEERSWSLREFKIDHRCERVAAKGYGRGRGRGHRERCTLEFIPETAKGNPYGPLFAATSTQAERVAFQSFFITQVESLAATSLTGIGMRSDDRFNTAQSEASAGGENDYLVNFEGNLDFSQSIQQRLNQLGSALTPADIVARAQTQTCAGCHRLSNNDSLGGGLTWPPSLGFTHVDERATENVDGVERFVISAALIDALLPQRKLAMEDFLNGQSHPGRGYRKLAAERSH
jgi:hypothetical protein